MIHWTSAVLMLVAWLAWPAPAAAQTSPLKATIFLRNPPPGAEYSATSPATPVTIVVQIQNVSGRPVNTIDEFSATEFWRRLIFTEPGGSDIVNIDEAGIHDKTAVGTCLKRGGQAVSIPVVPIEVLPGPPATTVAAPAAPTAVLDGAGGLPAGRYFYRVTAVTAAGDESGPSAETSITVATGGAAVRLQWPAVTGAAFYRVYRGTAAGAQSRYQVSQPPTFRDIGRLGVAGPPPPFFIEYVIDDARRFYDLSTSGRYRVRASIPLIVFDATDPSAVIFDCEQFPDDIVVNVGPGPLGRRAFTVVSNAVEFSVGQYKFHGFKPPLEADDSCKRLPCATFKEGDVIPVRFRVTDGAKQTVTTAHPRLSISQVRPVVTPPQDMGEVELGPRLHRYVMRLHTQGLAHGLWRIDVRLDDGSVHSVHFGLRKGDKDKDDKDKDDKDKKDKKDKDDDDDDEDD